MSAPRKSSTVHSVPASGPGALAGYSYTCPRCGLEITYSLESMVYLDAKAHKAWHEENSR